MSKTNIKKYGFCLFGLFGLTYSTRMIIPRKTIVITDNENLKILEIKHNNWLLFDKITVWYDPHGLYRNIPCYSMTIISFQHLNIVSNNTKSKIS